MSLNITNHVVNGGVLIITRTFSSESVHVINASVMNKTLDLIDQSSVRITFCIVYTIIFILGIFGNVLVCYVVFRNKAMHTVTNIFITNLALSDILLCIFAVPLTPMYTFLGKWVFGRLLCHLTPYAQGASIYISTFTLTSIARDRFTVIMHPFNKKMTLKTCIIIVVMIWVLSLILTFPYGLFMSIQTINNNTFYCEESWPSDRSRKVFGVLTTVLQFVLPFIVTTFCYTIASSQLNNRARQKPGNKNSRREKADRERKKRTNRMLIAMVAIFGTSWLPLNMVNIMSDFYEQTSEWKYFFIAFFLAHSMAMASTCYNPFLYAWMNENFRKEFKQVLPFFKPEGHVRAVYRLDHSLRNKTDENNCNTNSNDTNQKNRFISFDIISTKNVVIDKDTESFTENNILLEDGKPTSAFYDKNTENVCLQPINEELQSRNVSPAITNNDL